MSQAKKRRERRADFYAPLAKREKSGIMSEAPGSLGGANVRRRKRRRKRRRDLLKFNETSKTDEERPFVGCGRRRGARRDEEKSR